MQQAQFLRRDLPISLKFPKPRDKTFVKVAEMKVNSAILPRNSQI